MASKRQLIEPCPSPWDIYVADRQEEKWVWNAV